MIAGSRDKQRDDIAIPVAEGNDLVAFDLLMPVEAEGVSSFLRRRGRTIAMDDGHVLKTPLVYQTGPKTSAKSGWSCSI